MKNLRINKEKVISLLLAGSIALSTYGCTRQVKEKNDNIPEEITLESSLILTTSDPVLEATPEPTLQVPSETASPVYLELVNGPVFETIESDKEGMLAAGADLYNDKGIVINTFDQNQLCNKIATNGKYTLISLPNGITGFVLNNALMNNYQIINGYGFIRKGTNLYYDNNFTRLAYIVEDYAQIFYVDFTSSEYAGVFDANGRELMYVKPTEINKDYIIVDLDEQKMDCYLDYRLVGSWGTRTGKNSTPTHAGAFDIDWKASDWEFTTYPGSYAKYWIPINEYGEGIHDLVGDDEQNYGNQAYQLDGSHGCIRVPAEASEFVYENYEVGDMVLVRKK